jgi:hypothetical protein
MMCEIEMDPWAALCSATDALGDEEDEPPEASAIDECMVGALCAGGDDLAGRCAEVMTHKAV